MDDIIAAIAEHAARSLGGRAPVAAEAAAFVTTAMIRYLDFNDTVHGGHPSDALGAVLAVPRSVLPRAPIKISRRLVRRGVSLIG